MTSESGQFDVSVVVPTYNQSAMLRRLLDSFDKLAYSGHYEIILVDDCSPDSTPQVAKAWMQQAHAFEARYVKMDKNGGPGRARNRGAREARGRIVAYTDTDCIVTPGWLENLVRGIDRGNGIVGVGGRVEAFSEASMAARYYVFHDTLEPPPSTQYLVSCNCCYLREEMLAVGGFEEDIPRPGGEDIAVSIRLWKQGWRFAYEPKALIYHDFNPTLRNFWRTWWSYGCGTGLVCSRLLSPAEMFPERGEITAQNPWDARVVRPTVTGVRSYWIFLKEVLGQCRDAGLDMRHTFEVALMWTLNRLAYLYGWRQGEQLHRKETAQPR